MSSFKKLDICVLFSSLKGGGFALGRQIQYPSLFLNGVYQVKSVPLLKLS